MTSKKIYCFGGDHHVNDPPTVSRMDVSTGKWEKVAKMTSYRTEFASAQAGSKVYILGGYGRNRRRLSCMEVFDCETHTWTQLGLMPETRQRITAAVYNGFLYVAGSDTLYSMPWYDYTPEMILRYDIRNRKWKTMKSIQKIGSEHQLVVCDDRLYAISGPGKTRPHGSVEVYNPEADTWTRLDLTWDLPECWFSVAVNGSKIYITSFSGVEIYCPKSNKWTRFEDQLATCDMSLVSIDDKLIATGDWNGKTSVYCYQVRKRRRRRRGGTWSELPDMDTPRERPCSFVVDL